MPLYEFMDDAGRVIEAPYSMRNCPELGEVVEVPDPDRPGETVMATRILSNPARPTELWKPYISNALPRNLKGVPCTPSGKPIVTSQAQEREIASRLGMERD